MSTAPIPDLETAQRALFDALNPSATTRRVSWSEGETQVIEAGAGPPLLFVHGGFGQATDWMTLWPHLADRFRLLAVDRPGHGLADPYDFTGIDTRDLGMRFLKEMLEALDLADPVRIVGNSMGGRWALELALRQPDRVERLILVGAPAGSKAQIPVLLLTLRWPVTRWIMKRVFRRSEPKGVRDFFGRVLVAHAERLPEEYMVAMAAGQRRNYRSMFSFAKRVMTYRTINPELLMEQQWKRLQVPVHFIWGDADAFDLPETGRAAVPEIPAGADFTVIPGAGHLPWLDEPGAVALAIEKALGFDQPVTAPPSRTRSPGGRETR
jgi:pimeloyl-ACP methyl ester carboxylesterase